MLSYFTSPGEPRWTRWLLILFVPLMWLYFVAAKGNSETKNHDVFGNDQKVYLNTAMSIAHDPVGYLTPRQRTPGYAYFLSMFYSKDKFDVPDGTSPPFDLEWFERGKKINLYLSMGLLVGLFLFCRSVFPVVESGIVTVASGLLLFTFKAGYVQPELTYWVMNSVLFVLMGRMLIRPSWRLALVCGVLSTLTYLVKAGTQPLLFLFIVTWMIKLVWDRVSFWRRKRLGLLLEGEVAPRISVVAAQGVLVLVVYVVLLIPYFAGTQARFGEPTYSVYTKYMMWLPLKEDTFLANRDLMWGFYYGGARSHLITLDDYNESVKRAMRMRLKKESKGKLSAEELDALLEKTFKPEVEFPSRENYFERYSFGHSVERVEFGMKMLKKRIDKYYKRAISMTDWMMRMVVIGLGLRVVMWVWGRCCPQRKFLVGDVGDRGAWCGEILRRPYLVFYVTGFFVGYLVLYGWYDALGIGPRLALSLYLPWLLVWMLGVKVVYRNLVVRIPLLPHSVVYLSKVVNVILIVVLVYLSVQLMSGELYEHANTGG